MVGGAVELAEVGKVRTMDFVVGKLPGKALVMGNGMQAQRKVRTGVDRVQVHCSLHTYLKHLRYVWGFFCRRRRATQGHTH